MKTKHPYQIRLEAADGSTVLLSRWRYKRAGTCINKHLAELRQDLPFYQFYLVRSARIVCYHTPMEGIRFPVWSATVDELRRLIATGEAVRV